MYNGKAMIELSYEDAQDLNHVDHGKHLKFLYYLLEERLKFQETNISHKTLPKWEDHVMFVNEESPYDCHWVICYAHDPNALIGTVYITDRNEIGIQIARTHQGKGYGTRAIKQLLEQFPDVKFLANINPNNKNSIKFFEKFGFELISNTYKLKKTDDASYI
jgi:RimJ/RimL family protein N-acetyltransferase